MKRQAALAILVAVAIPVTARTEQDRTSGGVNHGTINVILGNQNGIVVLTDSMVTDGDEHQLRDPGQKLFKLDDKTVCTIAGFLWVDGGPRPEFFTRSAAIIEQYANDLKNNPVPGIREKLTSLGFLFNLDLSTIAGVRASTKSQKPNENYRFMLTIIGYDKDGLPKIGQIYLEPPLQGGFSDSAMHEPSITTVEKRLVPVLAGQPNIADGILKNPASVQDDAVVRAYADSMEENQGESLTLEQMARLASKLAWYTAQKLPSVGGPDQVAVLSGGQIVSIKQPEFPDPGKPPFRFVVVEEGTYGGGSQLLSSGVQQLFLRNFFTGGQVKLDGQYFYANSFVATDLIYDGGPVYFDKSNVVAECRLVLGKNVKSEDATVRQLTHDFQWNKVGHYMTK